MRRLALAVLPLLSLVVLGCPNKDSSSSSAAASATATVSPLASTAAPETNLAPLDDTATASATAGKPVKPTGTVTGGGTGLALPVLGAPSGASGAANAARIKQCCAGLRKQASTLGTAPQAQTFTQAAALCDGIASAVGAGPATVGQMPEFAPVRQLMTGQAIPAVCQGL